MFYFITLPSAYKYFLNAQVIIKEYHCQLELTEILEMKECFIR